MSWRKEVRVAGFSVNNDAYIDVTGATVDAYEHDHSISFYVEETGDTNGVTFKVQVRNNGADSWADHPDADLIDEAVAAGTAVGREIHAVGFRHYKVQAKRTASGQTGTATVSIIAK